MGWLIALGILVLLAVLPLGVSVHYDCDGPVVKIIAGLLRLQVVPARKKTDKNISGNKKANAVNRKQPKTETVTTKTASKESVAKPGGNFMDFLPLVQLALEFLGVFTRKLRVKRLEMNLILGGDDPCDLAVNYGRAWTAVGNLMPRLEKVLVIKKRDIDVECDFTASQTTIYARLDLTITLGRILAIAVVYGFRAIVELIKLNNKRKGGASK